MQYNDFLSIIHQQQPKYTDRKLSKYNHLRACVRVHVCVCPKPGTVYKICSFPHRAASHLLISSHQIKLKSTGSPQGKSGFTSSLRNTDTHTHTHVHAQIVHKLGVNSTIALPVLHNADFQKAWFTCFMAAVHSLVRLGDECCLLRSHVKG